MAGVRLARLKGPWGAFLGAVVQKRRGCYAIHFAAAAAAERAAASKRDHRCGAAGAPDRGGSRAMDRQISSYNLPLGAWWFHSLQARQAFLYLQKGRSSPLGRFRTGGGGMM